jgi:hypothetical protein
MDLNANRRRSVDARRRRKIHVPA